jgi:hypothetical protein
VTLGISTSAFSCEDCIRCHQPIVVNHNRGNTPHAFDEFSGFRSLISGLLPDRGKYAGGPARSFSISSMVTKICHHAAVVYVTAARW